MSKFSIFRFQKHSKFGNLAASAQHMFRERETPNADPALASANWGSGERTSARILEAVKERVALADDKADDPVVCIEYFASYSPEALSTEKSGDYLRDAIEFVEQMHGKENIISVQAHYDEKTPHVTIFAVPLIEREAKTRTRSVIAGRNEDGTVKRELREFQTKATVALSAAHFLDGREKLSKLQTNFHEKVGAKYGLERGIERSGARHQKVKRWYGQIEATESIERLQVAVAIAAEKLEAAKAAFDALPAMPNLKSPEFKPKLPKFKKPLVGGEVSDAADVKKAVRDAAMYGWSKAIEAHEPLRNVVKQYQDAQKALQDALEAQRHVTVSLDTLKSLTAQPEAPEAPKPKPKPKLSSKKPSAPSL